VVERPTHRNTSWDAARFEVAGHRFADLSEPGYGAALLNDGRYGHHALGSELGLSLLRSPIWPDPLADEGEQELVYALLPHAGSWLEGGVLAEAEDLNRPLLARPARGAPASLRPLAVDGLPVALGALKALEDGGGLVLRVYEPQGARGRIEVRVPDGWSLDRGLDLLERDAGAPSLELGPFAVRSYQLVGLAGV
jgi:alpha-mannosidase